MKVSIDNLTFKTIIGILPFEREKKQKVMKIKTDKLEQKMFDEIATQQFIRKRV